jgi:hypothetical protein
MTDILDITIFHSSSWFIEIRLYLHHQESNADYLTGFLADAKSNKTNMIDLTDLSNE